MNICTDCKYFKQEGMGIMVEADPKMALCMHPKAATRDMIYGRAFCQTERGASGKACGRTGKLWEKK